MDEPSERIIPDLSSNGSPLWDTDSGLLYSFELQISFETSVSFNIKKNLSV